MEKDCIKQFKKKENNNTVSPGQQGQNKASLTEKMSEVSKKT